MKNRRDLIALSRQCSIRFAQMLNNSGRMLALEQPGRKLSRPVSKSVESGSSEKGMFQFQLGKQRVKSRFVGEIGLFVILSRGFFKCYIRSRGICPLKTDLDACQNSSGEWVVCSALSVV